MRGVAGGGRAVDRPENVRFFPLYWLFVIQLYHSFWRCITKLYHKIVLLYFFTLSSFF